MSPTTVTLLVDQTQKLTVTFNPTNATNKNVTWESSDDTVATVDANGTVTAKGAGTATIIATSQDGNKEATATVEVIPVTPDTVTVTFDSDGGSDVETAIINKGAKVDEPTAPTKSGYTFKGWQLDGSDYDFDAAVNADITLVAIWEEVSVTQYTVTFDKNGGDTEADPASIKVNEGESVSTLPTAPTRSGFTFKGWATTNDATTANFDTSTAVTADITVYAVWEELPIVKIVIGGKTYDLNSETLPDGLSWEDGKLIMNNYQEEGYIDKASGENALKDLIIEVFGNNKLETNDTGGVIKGFTNLTIQGTGKLLVKQTQYNMGINVFSSLDKGLTVIGDVELTVEVEYLYSTAKTNGIHGNVTLEGNAKLVVSVDKKGSEEKEAYGISGDLTLTGTGDVNITVTNAGNGEVKAVRKTVTVDEGDYRIIGSPKTGYVKYTQDDSGMKIINIGEVYYDLNDKEIALPEGLYWDATEEVLTMEDYNGSYINATDLENITIKVRGTNTIEGANDKGGLALKGKSTIEGEGDNPKLTLNTYDWRDIEVTNGSLVIDNVELSITKDHNSISHVYGIVSNGVTLQKGAKLSINITSTKELGDPRQAYGLNNKLTLEDTATASITISANKALGTVYGVKSLELNGTGDVEINVTNTNTGSDADAMAVYDSSVSGTNKDNYVFVIGEGLGSSWDAAKIKATYK